MRPFGHLHRASSTALLMLLAACGEPIVGNSPPASPGELARAVIEGDDVVLQEDTPRSLDALRDVSDGARFDAASISVEVAGSNAPVDAESFEFERDGDTVRLTITPLPDQNGEADIEVIVREDGEETLRFAFHVEVEPVNDAPTIDAIDDQETSQGEAIEDLAVSVADVDNDADALTVSVAADDEDLATFELGGEGEQRTLTIAPMADASGTTTVTVTVDDGEATASASFELTIEETTDEPPTVSAIDDPAAIDEDTSTPALAFTVADPDTDLDALSVSATSSDSAVVTDAGITLAGSGADRSATVEPVADASGSATITVLVSDGTTTVMTSFTVTVDAVDDPAEFVDALADQTTPEDTPLGPLAFAVTDRDTAAADVSISATSEGGPIDDSGIDVTSGTFDPTITLTPRAGASGVSVITVEISDGTTAITDSFMVTVTAVDDPPEFTATVADQTIDEDGTTGAITFGILDTDSAPPALTLSATSSGGPIDAAGVVFSAIAQTDGAAMPTVTVTPLADASGTSTITLSLSDGTTTVTESFDVTVDPVNDPPVIEAGPADTGTTEDTDTAAVGFTVLDVDNAPPELALATVTCNSPCASVAFSAIAQDGSGRATPTLTVTPVPNASGVTDVTFSLTDGTVSVTDTFQLTVNAADDPPSFVTTIPDQTIDEDNSTAAIGFTISDIDSTPPALTLSATSSGGPVSAGGVAFSAINQVAGSATPTVTVTPDADASGTSTITVSLTDGTTTVTDSFNVTVNPVNDAPVIEAGPADTGTTEDTDTAAVGFTVLDVDNAPPELALATVTCNSPCASVAFSAFAQDAAGRATPTLTVTPVPNASGVTDVTFSLTDGTVSVTDTFQLTVGATNDPPTIGAIGAQTTDEDVGSTPVAFAVDDIDDNNCTLSLSVFNTDNATLADAGDVIFDQTDCNNPQISVVPKTDQSGVVNLGVRVTDIGGLSADTTFSLMVNAVNDPPTIGAIADQTINEDGSTGALAFTVGDVETAAGSLMVTATSDNPTVVPNDPANLVLGGSGANRSIDVVPAADQSGSAQITVQVSDGVTPVTEVFQLTVNAIDDPPSIAVAIADQTIDENTSTLALAFTVDDVDTPLASLTVAGGSTNTTLLPEPGAYAFGGAGGNRTVTLTPAASQFGVATITLSVSDASTTVPATTTFDLTVNDVNDPPTAVTDDYLGASGTTGNQHRAFATSVLANDLDDGPLGNLTATTVTGGATTKGGSFDMNADGTFTYYPPVGFVGTDTFSYTVNDNDASDPRSDTGTVNIAVSAPMVWFVDNTAAAGGDGRSHMPFRNLTSVEGVVPTTTNDQVHLAYGDGTTSFQNAGVSLQAGMDLIGVPNGVGALPVITNSGGNGVTLSSNCTVQNVEINAPSGAGILGAGVSGATVLDSVDITLAAGGGVSIAGSGAGATLSLSDMTISTSGGEGVAIDNGGTVSASGTVTVMSTAGRALDLRNSAIDGATGFDIDSLTVVNNGGTGGVRIESDSGGAISIGDLSVTTTGGTGLAVSSNTTSAIDITGSSNTIDATSGAAIVASNSAIDWTFLRVSANGGSYGIDLSSTTGSLTVTGDGALAENASGGILQNQTTGGVRLAGAGSVSLNRVRVLNAPDDGLLASGATSLTMTYSRVDTAGNAFGDHGIDLTDLTGSLLFDNLEIDTAYGDGIRLQQNSGTIASFTLQDSNLHDSVTNTAINAEVRNAAAITSMSIDGSSFSNVTKSLTLFAYNTASVDMSFTDNAVDSHTSDGLDIGIGSGSPSLSYTVTGNTFTNVAAGSVHVVAGTGSTGTLRGLVDNNIVGQAGVGGSGSRSVFGVDLRGNVDSIVEITNNTVHEYGNDNALFIITGEGLPLSATAHFYIANNSITDAGNDSVFEPYAIYANDGLNVCAQITGNSATAGMAFSHYALYEGLLSAPADIFLANFTTNGATTLTNEGNTSAGGAPIVDEIGPVSGGTCSRLP